MEDDRTLTFYKSKDTDHRYITFSDKGSFVEEYQGEFKEFAYPKMLLIMYLERLEEYTDLLEGYLLWRMKMS